jgi:hypothetical protein
MWSPSSVKSLFRGMIRLRFFIESPLWDNLNYGAAFSFKARSEIHHGLISSLRSIEEIQGLLEFYSKVKVFIQEEVMAYSDTQSRSCRSVLCLSA